MLDQVVNAFQSVDAIYRWSVGGGIVSLAGPWFCKKVWAVVSPGTADDWFSQAARFEPLSPKTYAIWNRVEDSPRVDWSVYPMADEATRRDIELFLPVAAHAGRMFRRSLSQRIRCNWVGRSDADVWLDVIHALASPASDMRLSGRGPEGSSVGGVLNNLAQASVIACNRIAIGEGPTFWISAISLVRSFVLRKLRVRRVERLLLKA